MKKNFALLFLLIISTISFSQSITTISPSPTKSDYLQKSKNQKKLGHIFLAGGTGCVLTAFLIPLGKEIVFDTGGTLWGIPIQSARHKNLGIKGAFFLTGTLSMLISIPLYSASHRYKKKGMRLSFKNESIPKFQQGCFISKVVPSVNLKIKL